MKTSQNEIVLTCYRSAVRNANTPIGHNIAFLRNTLGIDIDNNDLYHYATKAFVKPW